MNNNDPYNSPLNTNNGINQQPMNQPQMNQQPMNQQPTQQPVQPQKKSVNVPLLVILGIVLMSVILTVTAFTSHMKDLDKMLDSSRVGTYVSTAIEYCRLARNMNLSNQYVSCDGTATKDLKFKDMDDNSTTVSPFGNPIDLTNSYIRIEAIKGAGGACNVQFSIYMTDGQYDIGTKSNPAGCTSLTQNSVLKK